MMDMIFQIEDIIHEVCNVSYKDEWNEDHLTLSLISKLRDKLKNKTFKYNNITKYINWFPYKQKGIPEQKFGDIAIIIKIDYQSNNSLVGVAFLEAKRIYDSGKFEALDFNQLIKIRNHAPHSYLIMYDNQNNNLTYYPYDFPFPFLFNKFHTYALTAPINTIIPFNKNERTIYRFANPFSIQLISRYFFGLDLEYNKETVDIALGNRPDLGQPKNLLLISVSYNEYIKEDYFGLDLKNWELL